MFKIIKIMANCSKLVELRIKAGLSRVALAERTGASQPTISRIESGKASASPILANKIAESLGIPFDDIFSIVEGE